MPKSDSSEDEDVSKKKEKEKKKEKKLAKREKKEKKDKKKKRDKDKDSRSKSKSRSRERSPEKDRDSRSRSRNRDRRSKDKSRDADRGRDRSRRSRRSRSRSRDRERGRRDRSRRSRSKSRSKSRNRSRSRSRSKTRSRRSRRSKSRSRSPAKPRANPMFDAAAIAQAVSASANLAIGIAPKDPNQMLILQANDIQLTRQARRLYVGNLPIQLGLTEAQLTEYFMGIMKQIGLQTPDPILSVWISSEGTFCFVEMRAIADTTACLLLLQNLTLGGRPLRVGRPADYKAPEARLSNFMVGYPPDAYKPPVTPAGGLIGGGLGMMGIGGMGGMGLGLMGVGMGGMAGLGGLAAIPGMTAMTAGAALNGLLAGTATTTTESVSPVAITSATEAGPTSLPTPAATLSEGGQVVESTSVLLLLNMATMNELVDDEEFGDIVLDVREESETFGKVEAVVIPRPVESGNIDDKSGVELPDRGPKCGVGLGRIFVHFAEKESCEKAYAKLNGRMFNNNKVEARYYSLEDLRSDKFDK